MRTGVPTGESTTGVYESLNLRWKPRHAVDRLDHSTTTPPTPTLTYAQVVRQNIPGWLKNANKSTVYHPRKNDLTDQEKEKRAREKYGRGYRPEPPKRNRELWKHFLERNLQLAKNNYHGCTQFVQRVIEERETMERTPAWRSPEECFAR